MVYLFITAKRGPRIWGGRNATKDAYPYQVSIQYKGIHDCGGSIISEEWILTAAHCLQK